MKPVISYACALIAISYAAVSSAAPTYSIVPIGFDDLEHTRNDGYRSSTAEQLNEAGLARGISARYNGGSAPLGTTAWLYDGTTTQEIGLTSSEYTRSDGIKQSATSRLNEAGQVIGASSRYSGSTSLGQTIWLFDGVTTPIGLAGSEHTRNDGYKNSNSSQLNEAGYVTGSSYRYNGGSSMLGSSAWLYDGATTRDIGLTGAQYTRNDGYSYSSITELNATGKVAGVSARYNGGSSFGQTAWLYDGTSTFDIGLTGPEYTRNDGFKSSNILSQDASALNYINDAGQVRGVSTRFNGGSANLGQTAWLYNGTTTSDIGLVGSEHTRNDGYKYSTHQQLNQAGQVLGLSYRYNGGAAQLGQTAWLYNGTTTLDIGLVDDEHTRIGGYKLSTVGQLNQAGRARGSSRRYNSSNGIDLGQTAWLYDGTTTIDIGLTGSEHTRNDGYKYSSTAQLNEAGQVSGTSQRYNGGNTSLGYSAWLRSGATTTDVGLTDSAHTRNDGYKYSVLQQLNEAGQVRGYSYRYNGGSTQLGQDAWFYDAALNQNFSLTLSTRSDGFAYSRADFLGEDGLVLGTYQLFDAQDNNLGDRAFSFSIADGLHDLGSLVEGGLAANGWDWLAGSPIKPAVTDFASALGQVVGFGKPSSQSAGQMAYLLTPVNPLPGDYDFNGVVDTADYMVWRKSLGQTGPVLAADGNRDHQVDATDLDVWKLNFGKVLGSAAAAGALGNATVPEPAAIFQFLSLAAGLYYLRPRRFLRYRDPV